MFNQLSIICFVNDILPISGFVISCLIFSFYTHRLIGKVKLESLDGPKAKNPMKKKTAVKNYHTR